MTMSTCPFGLSLSKPLAHSALRHSLRQAQGDRGYKLTANGGTPIVLSLSKDKLSANGFA